MGPWGPIRRASLLAHESAVLQSLQIVFQATCDLKVWDAAPLVELVAEDGRLLAHSVRNDQPGAPCSNSEVRAETLHIQGHVRPSDVQGAVVRIHIEPAESGERIFNWHLNYEWTGQERQRSTTFTNINLSHQGNEQSWSVNFQPAG